ncbi:MAG: hypothetical protein DWQ05_18390 [Calditrichaeota bacterium]|nr:MAG: hypothetical protein DWQ05_18390 [Calditrichota bacterium]
MKSARILTVFIFLLAMSVGNCFGGELPGEGAPRRFRINSANPSTNLPQEKQGFTGNNRALKAFLFSAIIPGTGQLYNKNKYRGLAFFAVELASIFYYIDQNDKGNEYEALYETFADNHWVESRYWDALAAVSGEKRSDMEALREYESGRWSHHLPERRNQTYYENIGKYDQFNSGWDDALSDFGRDSELREEYTFIRKDSNDAFNRAGMAISIVMVNHVLSALEAGYTAHKQNNGLQASMKIVPQKTGANDFVPALSMRLSW